MKSYNQEQVWNYNTIHDHKYLGKNLKAKATLYQIHTRSIICSAILICMQYLKEFYCYFHFKYCSSNSGKLIFKTILTNRGRPALSNQFETKVKRWMQLPKVIQHAKHRARTQNLLILVSCFNTGKCCLSQAVSRNCIYALTVK